MADHSSNIAQVYLWFSRRWWSLCNILECREPPADKLMRGVADPRDDFTSLNPAISQVYRAIHPLNQQRLMRFYKSFDYSFTSIVHTIIHTIGDRRKLYLVTNMGVEIC